MTRGNPTRLLIRLAVPLILANLGQQLYGIVDAIIVGQDVGVDAFAALGACDWLVWLVLWSVQGLFQMICFYRTLHRRGVAYVS